MPCKSILIVEDDDDIRKQVTMALELEGYQVHTATNGKQALETLSSLSEDEMPGCMILDLMMPEMDGPTLMRTIDSDYPQFKGIKVLVATAKGSPINPASLPHAVDHLQKPFDLEELYAAVEEHCGKP